MLTARRYAIGFFLLFLAASVLLNRFAPRTLEGSIGEGWNDGRFDWLPGVTVGWQGERIRTRTDHRGRFSLPVSDQPRRLIATRQGYRIAEVRGANSPFLLRLESLPPPAGDATNFGWIDPHRDASKPENCANCHGEIYREWRQSAHSRSAVNPKFLSLYAGTNDNAPPHKTWNVQQEHPHGDAVCTMCHVPTFQSYLHEDVRSAQGVHKSGIHCDLCHKVSDVPTGKFGTRFGRDALELVLPPNGDLLTFGPLDDAVRKGESFAYSPVYKESRYCASCHEGVVFGVHAYGTYSEWLESPARREGKQCQSCHMTPTGLMTNIAPGKGGIERNPFTLASHHTPGGQPAMLKKAISLDMNIKNDARGRLVHIGITAANVGHRVPTGFPDRQLILVVTATDASGKIVPATSGPRLPASTGNWTGHAGSLFAKQLVSETGRTPIPFWLHVDQVLDTRLVPDVIERRTFVFPESAHRVTAQVWYRRFWHEVAEGRGWKDNDVLVFELSK